MKHGHRWYASIATAMFTAGAATHETLFSRAVGLYRMLSYHLLQTLSNVTEVLLCVLGVAAAHGRQARPLRELGLRAPIPRSWSVSGGRLGPPPPFQDLMSRMNFP